MLRFYNTMTRQKEDFHPIQAEKVGMYTCGPTVYNYAHIGNYRAYMFEDLWRRYLRYRGYEVTQVMNLLLLAPEIQERVLRGDLEAAERALRGMVAEPNWAEQHVLAQQIGRFQGA